MSKKAPAKKAAPKVTSGEYEGPPGEDDAIDYSNNVNFEDVEVVQTRSSKYKDVLEAMPFEKSLVRPISQRNSFQQAAKKLGVTLRSAAIKGTANFRFSKHESK